MDKPKLYRRRYIPNENVLLKDDEIVLINDEFIVTKWKSLKPRRDFSHGCSCYFLKKGYKVSKFFDHDGKLVYTYCDIVDCEFDAEQNTYTFHDLLVDVIVYENGFIKVADLAEISEALNLGLINIEMAKRALVITDLLLSVLYNEGVKAVTKNLENIFI